MYIYPKSLKKFTDNKIYKMQIAENEDDLAGFENINTLQISCSSKCLGCSAKRKSYGCLTEASKKLQSLMIKTRIML